jgi:hypothetical protein
MTAWRRGLVAAALLACLTARAAPAPAATRYDPRLRFRSIQTAHFTIHYHQGEEQAARRLAVIAEDVRRDLEARLKLAAPRHTQVVLVDQSDLSNGWATPVPYDLVEVTLAPPAPESFVGNHDDWLRMVFTHEYMHILHLDQVGGWMRAFRWAFGRQPVSFPNLFVPAWQVEGMATFAESATTGLGRVHAADVRAVVAAGRAGDRFPAPDQVSGGQVAWPWGHGPYFYGGQFIDALARRSDEAHLGELARETSRRFPFFWMGAFPRVFGEGASALWREFAQASRGNGDVADGTSSVPAPRRVSSSGYLASGPRFAAGSHDTAAKSSEIVYSVADPHGFAAVWLAREDGRHRSRVFDRLTGSTVSFDGDWVVYDRLEFDGPVAQCSDLYAHDRRSGRTTRLTRGARLLDADVAPDRTRLAAVASSSGGKAVAVYALSHGPDGTPALADAASWRLGRDGCVFGTPRWSPNGALIAASMHCEGALPVIVVVTPGSDRLIRVPAPAGSRNVTPAWTPDGRWLVFSSDREPGGFALHAAPVTPAASLAVGSARLLVRGSGDAMYPDVDPTGRRVAFVDATPGGLDVFVAPMPALPASDAAAPVSAPESLGDQGASVQSAPTSAGDSPPASRETPYSPWSTLWPRAWTPVLSIDNERVDVGASVGGTDALARHQYTAIVWLPASRPATSPGFPSSARPDWQVSYAYDRWRPTVFASASDETEVSPVLVSNSAAIATADVRTRKASAGVFVPVRRLRWNQGFLFGADVEERRISLPGGDVRRMRNGLWAGWSFASSRQFGYSVSPERGVRFGTTVERVLPELGADGSATTAAADLRAYAPAGPRHAALAVRVAAGASSGDRGVRRVFTNGGSSASSSTVSLDSGAIGLVRGFGESTLAGTAAAALNVDWRFPLLRIERGLGPWPLFLNVLHGAIFVDTGSAGRSLGSLGTPIWSAGAECSALVTVGFGFRISVTGGVAYTHQSARADPGQVSAFARTGFAF